MDNKEDGFMDGAVPYGWKAASHDSLFDKQYCEIFTLPSQRKLLDIQKEQVKLSNLIVIQKFLIVLGSTVTNSNSINNLQKKYV